MPSERRTMLHQWAVESLRALPPASRKKVLDGVKKLKAIKARDEAIKKAKAKG